MTIQIRLMTYNLRVSAADDGPNAWEFRWPLMRALIRELHPQVLGAQECMPNQMAALGAELYDYFAYPGPDTMHMGYPPIRNPIFLCDTCVRPLAHGALSLNASGVIGHVGWDAGESRLAHWLRFPGLMLVNTHFDAWGEGARYESARLIADFLRAEPAAVVMGDLNCAPDSPPIAHFREAGFALAKDALSLDVDRRTLTKFTGRQLAEIDYILMRGVPVRQVMIPRPRQEPPYPSDHDPVVADLVFG